MPLLCFINSYNGSSPNSTSPSPWFSPLPFHSKYFLVINGSHYSSWGYVQSIFFVLLRLQQSTLSSKLSLVILSIYLIISTFLRHLFVNTYILFRQEILAFHVSHPYNRTNFTFELKILSFILSDISLVLQILLEDKNAAFPILYFFLFPHPCL